MILCRLYICCRMFDCFVFVFVFCCCFCFINVFVLFGLKIFTNRYRRCRAFFGHNVQNSLVASICMSLESKTNRSKDALQSNQFHRSHHNVSLFDHYLLVDQMNHRRAMWRQLVFVNIVDSFGNPQRMVPVCLLLLIHRNHLDKKFQQQAY